jgi:ribosomal protein S27AE
MYSVDIQGLKPNTAPPNGCLLPKIVKLRGRPKIARIRKGQYRREKRRCGNCGELAHHNARSCRAQPCDVTQQSQAQNSQNTPILSYSERMIQDRAEARARRIQQELEDEQEEANFERQMEEAIQSRSRRFSISSSINEWEEEFESSSDYSQLDTDPLV